MGKKAEKVYELLKQNAENVSANHWINAIHEDKFEDLSHKIVKLCNLQNGYGELNLTNMFLDKILTPEQYWDKIKHKIFKGDVPVSIESLMQKGFLESDCESEKWLKISKFMEMTKQIFG